MSYHQAGTCQEILEGPQEFLVFDGRRRFVETWTETHDCQLDVCLELDLGYSTRLVVWSMWSLDGLFVVPITVAEVFVCEGIFR